MNDITNIISQSLFNECELSKDDVIKCIDSFEIWKSIITLTKKYNYKNDILHLFNYKSFSLWFKILHSRYPLSRKIKISFGDVDFNNKLYEIAGILSFNFYHHKFISEDDFKNKINKITVERLSGSIKYNIHFNGCSYKYKTFTTPPISEYTFSKIDEFILSLKTMYFLNE